MAITRPKDLGFLHEKLYSHSFLDALSGSSASSFFLELKSTTYHGLPSLWISYEEILALMVPFKFTLVRYFLACRSTLEVI